MFFGRDMIFSNIFENTVGKIRIQKRISRSNHETFTARNFLAVLLQKFQIEFSFVQNRNRKKRIFFAKFQRFVPRKTYLVFPYRKDEKIGRQIFITNAMCVIEIFSANSHILRNCKRKCGNIIDKPRMKRRRSVVQTSCMKNIVRIDSDVLTVHLFGNHDFLSLQKGKIVRNSVILASSGRERKMTGSWIFPEFRHFFRVSSLVFLARRFGKRDK